MNPRFRQGRTDPALLAVLILAPLLLATCQDFFGTSDLKQQIKDDVIDATAPTINVYIASPDASAGTPSPFGSQTWKVGASYTINTSVDSDYAFAGWSASGDTGTPIIAFSSTSSTMTTVTVTAEYSGTITITPTYNQRPYVDQFENENKSDVDIRTPIKLWFSENVSNVQKGTTINVSMRPANPSTPEEAVWQDINSYFGEAQINQTLVLLALNSDAQYGMNSVVKVTLTTGITDETGYGLSSSAQNKFLFYTGDQPTDTTPPSINTFSITNTAGVTTTAASDPTKSPTFYTKDTAVTLNISAADSGSSVAYVAIKETSSDGTTSTSTNTNCAYSNSIAYTIQNPGAVSDTIGVRVADSLGNWTDEDAVYIPVAFDTTAPGTPSLTGTYTNLNNGIYWYSSGGVTFSFTATDTGGAGMKGYKTVSMDVTAAKETLTLTVGSHTVYAVDRAGNVSLGTVTVPVGQDTTRPVLGDATSAAYKDSDGYWISASGSATFKFAPSDKGVGEDDESGVASCYYCKGGSTTKNYLTYNSADSTYSATVNEADTYSFFAVDRAGNISSVTGTSITVKKDSAPPSLDLSMSPDIVYNATYWYTGSDGVAFTADPSDGASGSGISSCYYTVNTGSTRYPLTKNATTDKYEVTQTTAATYHFYVSDNAGNTSDVQSIKVGKDTTAPDAPSVSGSVYLHSASGGTSTTVAYSSGTTSKTYWYPSGYDGVNIVLSSSDSSSGVVTYSYTKDGGSSTEEPANPDGTLSITLAAGSYAFSAVDRVGLSFGTLSFTVRQETTVPAKPTVESDSDYVNTSTTPYTYWYSASDTDGVLFTLSGSDDTDSGFAGYCYSIGDSTSTTAIAKTSGKYTVSLTENSSSYHFYAKDNAGNRSPAASIMVDQDSSAPTTPTVSDHSGYYYGGSKYWYPKNDSDGVSFTISSTDPAGGSGFKEYLLGSVSTTASQTKTAGTYVYTATDKAGNTSSSLTVTIAQDSAPPTIGGTLASTDGTSVSGFSASDPAGGSGLDTDSYDASSGSFDGSALSGLTAPTEDGDTDYTVSVSDNAGNAATVTVRLTRSTDGEGTVSYTAAIVLP
jgi:hypothetical protein